MIYVKYKKWWDTRYFHQTGDLFKENRFYCPFPEGTKAFDEFWDEQESYIRNGYTVDGQRTSGLHYLYANYCPIWNKKRKKHEFPDFRAIDAEWFLEIEEVMALGPHLGNYMRPVGHVTGKTRQSGHSLKAVVPVLYNMNFVPGTKNYIGAYMKGQAQKTNSMYQMYHDHLYKYTDFGKGWLKKETGEYYKTGYFEDVNGQYQESGFLTELKIIGFSDSTEKGVGGGIDLFILEECGAFPGLLEVVIFLKNACKDGDLTTGNLLAYGAAGKLSSAVDLQELMEDPEPYDFKGYPDIWNPDGPGSKKVGMFIPNYSCREPYFDKDGNPLEEEAIKAKERSLIKLKDTNYEKYLQEASQMPNNISEMFSIRQKARFPAGIIDPHLNFLETHKGELTFFVELIPNFETKGIEYKFTDKKPIWDSPVPKGLKDQDGVFEIVEFPEEGARYIAAIDSYNQQESITNSMGHIVIFKTQGGLNRTGRIPVAEWYGKPATKYEMYNKFALLQRFYNNAIALPENEDIELVPWYYNNELDWLLADQPDIIRNYIPNSTVKRSKGIHATTPLIIAGENKIHKYLTEIIGNTYDDQGNVTGIKYGVSRILLLGLLRELRRYVHDPKLNFDRERTFGWVMLYEEEMYTNLQSESQDSEASSFLMNTTRLTIPLPSLSGYSL